MMIFEEGKIANRRACGKAFVWLLLTVLLHGAVRAGGLQARREGARSAAMGAAMTAVQGHSWALSWNPAALPVKVRAAVFASPAPYGLETLARAGVALNVPVSDGALGLTLTRYGGQLYRETGFSVGAMHPVADGVRIGVVLRAWHLAIERYGAAASYTGDIGVHITPLPSLTIAACASNITLGRIGAGEGERLPAALAIGTAWSPVEGVLLSFDLVHDTRYSPGVRLGIEYHLHERVILRTGTTGDPASFTAGVGLCHAGWTVNYAVLLHPDLGGTHLAGIEFQPKGGLF